MLGNSLRAAARAVCILVAVAALCGCPPKPPAATPNEDIAQEWMRLVLHACGEDSRMPTVETRTFFHVCIAMYDAWAAYDDTAVGYLTGNTLKQSVPANQRVAKQVEALSHAVFLLAQTRFSGLTAQPAGSDAQAAYAAFTSKMKALGYIDANGQIVPSDAQAVGKQVAEAILAYAANDNSNEANGYADTTNYRPVNHWLDTLYAGTDLTDFNRWQPLQLPNGTIQTFLTPHWGLLPSFALPPYSVDVPYHDPGLPPLFQSATGSQFVQTFSDLVSFSGSLDPTVGAGADTIDISPAVQGGNTPGYDDGDGYPINPFTLQPYAHNYVKRGDYYRVLATMVDGNYFTTPCPWWFEVATDVLAGTGYVSQRPSNKAKAHDLAYDVKLYFALAAAQYDAAITIWDIKRTYDWVRPISAIRALGQYDALQFRGDFVETIGEDDPLAGENNENVGHQKIFAWRGPDQGCGWMLPDEWLPYQRLNFVTPPFPGYSSGHSCFGPAFGEVMQEMTEDSFFPGGLAQWTADTLPFELGPSSPVTLQWATYMDAGDVAGYGRLCAGVHPFADVRPSRLIGREIGKDAVKKAKEYFAGTATPAS